MTNIQQLYHNQNQIKMDKSILIASSSATSRAAKAQEIANQFSKDEVVQVSDFGSKFHEHHFLFSECEQTTKLVILELREDLKNIEALFNFISTPVPVEKRGQSTFLISPRFLITVSAKTLSDWSPKLGASFHRRFDIVKC